MKNINQIFNDNYEMIDNIAGLISKRYGVYKDELLGYGFEILYNYISDKDQEELNHHKLYLRLHRDMTRCVPEILGYGQSKTFFFNYIKEKEKLTKEYMEEGIEVTIDIDFVTKVVDSIAENSKTIISNEKKEQWKNMILLCNSASLNEISEASDLAYLEKLSETIESEYISKELKKELLDSMYALSDRDKDMLIEKYGLDDKGLRTYIEVGNKHYISDSRVLARETQSLSKIRRQKSKKRLQSYTDYDYRINGSNSSSEVGRIIS